jgi:serine/threonine-protein kinase PknK
VRDRELSMIESDPSATQHDLTPSIAAELAAAGFEGAEEIGRGGFGVVYRCRQISLDRTVAIKVLTPDPDPENLERFLREQRAMGRVSGHPNIVHILEVGAAETGRPYIVMEYHDTTPSRCESAGRARWRGAKRSVSG